MCQISENIVLKVNIVNNCIFAQYIFCLELASNTVEIKGCDIYFNLFLKLREIIHTSCPY